MSSSVNLECPNCNNHIAKSQNGEVKLRAKLIKWTEKGMFAVCQGCGDDVPVNVGFFKSLQARFSYEIPA